MIIRILEKILTSEELQLGILNPAGAPDIHRKRASFEQEQREQILWGTLIERVSSDADDSIVSIAYMTKVWVV